MATDQETKCDEDQDHDATMEERNHSSGPPSPRGPSDDNMVEEIIAIVESVRSIGEYRRTQRKECQSLVRRLKLFLPLLEEIRDGHKTATMPESAVVCLKKMKKAFISAKKLLKLCRSGSKIYLALESEAMTVRIRGVYDKISQAVEGMPFEELGISQEEREQVELLQVQIRRAKKRSETQDIELTMDLMVALSTNNDRNADSASVERLASKLSLRSVEELRQETLAIKKLVKERRGANPETTQQIVDLLKKLKRLVGVGENNGMDSDTEMPRCLDKCASIVVPNEFFCPITLEIMRDPVIVATGQTYERESIQQWLDSNHQTCPKTGQVLTHLSLAPNFALKNLILQWCEKNNYQLPKREDPPPAENAAVIADGGKILALVQNLSTGKLEDQRKAVEKIRRLSKENADNRTLIAGAGGIPLLVQLLSYPDLRIQEHTVTALLNLSIDESNKRLISDEEPIPQIVEILEKGNVGAKENSAAALFSLSMLHENKVKIGTLGGIPPLIDLLRSGTIRGKKDAVTALFNLCLNSSNKCAAIAAGIVPPLIVVLGDEKLEMVNESLSLLLILASSPEGTRELGQLPFIETLVNLIRDGSPKNQECAAAVLLELGSNNRNLVLAALQYGVYDCLVEVSNNGTERGQRKANALMKLMSKAGYLP